MLSRSSSTAQRTQHTHTFIRILVVPALLTLVAAGHCASTRVTHNFRPPQSSMLALMSAAVSTLVSMAGSRRRLLALLLLALICFNGHLVRSVAAEPDERYEMVDEDAADNETSKQTNEPSKCQIHDVSSARACRQQHNDVIIDLQNPHIFAIMDKICEMCHDMFSHRRPNMRAECRYATCSTISFISSSLKL